MMFQTRNSPGGRRFRPKPASLVPAPKTRTAFLSVAAFAFAACAALMAPQVHANEARVELKTALGHAVMKSGERARAYLRISLKGLRPADEGERSPANIAIVVDKSGSMKGEKIADAREAVRLALDLMRGGDHVSVVAFNHEVHTLLPATPASDLPDFDTLVDRISADGRTALYAGVEAGLENVGDFLDPYSVNRVILISDGLANVGPTSPEAIARLARDAAQDGISITTIGLGLGYNEDLMTRLALTSDGNHAFAEHPDDLIDIFNNEFGEVFSVVAQGASVDINFAEGIKPLRALGRPAKIKGQRVSFDLRQIYGGQEKYLLVEVEIDGKAAGETLKAADITARYTDIKTKRETSLSGQVEVGFSDDAARVKASRDAEVLSAAALQIATERSERAVKLRDSGQVKEAEKLLQDNAAYLRRKAKSLAAPELDDLAEKQESDAKAMSGAEWTRQRKLMRSRQYKGKTQQGY